MRGPCIVSGPVAKGNSCSVQAALLRERSPQIQLIAFAVTSKTLPTAQYFIYGEWPVSLPLALRQWTSATASVAAALLRQPADQVQHMLHADLLPHLREINLHCWLLSCDCLPGHTPLANAQRSLPTPLHRDFANRPGPNPPYLFLIVVNFHVVCWHLRSSTNEHLVTLYMCCW